MPSELRFSRSGDEAWAAIVEAGRAVEIRYARRGRPGARGDIHLARVDRWVPGLGAAFVDLGAGPNGFLPVRAQASAARGRDAAEVLRPPSAGERRIVQIAREAAGRKGPEVTERIALGGRFVVCFPQGGPRSVSNRIAGESAQRLSVVLRSLEPAGAGFVARSAAGAASEADVLAEAGAQRAAWAQIVESAKDGKPRLLRAADDLLVRMLQDAPPEGYARVVVDDSADLAVAEAAAAGARPPAGTVHLHSGRDPLLTAGGLGAEWDAAHAREIELPSGGSIVIDTAEALVAIDVNSGGFVAGMGPAETALVTNLEAAAEIARQLRLRDLGGTVVVDFLDLDRPEDRRRVERDLEQRMRADHARTRLGGWTRLGLYELTRERKGEGWPRTPGPGSRNPSASAS